MKRHGRWLIAALGAALLVGAGALAWHLRAQQKTYYTDAKSIRQTADQGSPRDILWTPPVRLGHQVNTAQDEHGAALSFDGNELFFVRGRAGRGADIHVMRRGPQGWSPPEAVASLNSPADDLRPNLAPDGQTLYFASNRLGGEGGYDLWLARRSADGWMTPVNLGPEINSRYDDYAPAVAFDGHTVFFASNRPKAGDETALPQDAWAAQIAEDAAGRDYDLYVASDGAVVALETINTDSNESAPAVSPAGDFLYFASDRPGGAGGFDLYRTRNVDGSFTPPVSLGKTVNTSANELDATLGDAGFSLHFSSDRADEGSEGPKNYDLHYAMSREVYRFTETWRTPFDLAALWAMIWPWLLFTAVVAAVLLALADVFRRLKYRRLDLVVQCLLFSLIAHMLLMLVFAFWAVSVAPAWTRPSSGMKVALTSPALGAGMTRQLRGDLVTPELASTRQEAVRTDYRDETGDRFEAATRVAVQRARIDVQISPIAAREVRDARPARLPDAAPRRLEPEREPSPVQVRVPAEAAPQSQTEETPAALVAGSPVATDRADHSLVVVPPRADGSAVPMAPRAAESPLTDSTLAPAQARDATVQTVVAINGPDPEAMRDLGGEVPLEFAALPERIIGAPANEQGVLGQADLGVTAVAAARVSVPTAPPPAEVAVRPGAVHSQSTEASMTVSPNAEAEAPWDLPPAEQTDEVLVALPALELPDLPEYHRTQLGQPNPGERFSVAAAPPVAVDAPLSMMEPGAPLAPQAAVDDSGGSSMAPVVVTDAAAASATGAERLGGHGPDPLQIAYAPLEEVAAPPAGELTEQWSAGEPSVPRGAFEPMPLDAPALVPELSVAAAPNAVETPRAPRTPIPDVQPPPREQVELEVFPAATLALLPLDLRLPTQIIPNPYPQRDPAQTLKMAKKMGGDARTEEAVTLALDWLARHQSSDGRWDGTHFDDDCGACAGVQQVQSDIALTGLSVLCFQAAGHTHKNDGPYRDAVARGVEWLLSNQASSGALYGKESLYSHGIATIALAEAYGMTGDPRLERAVKIACNYIYAARHKPRGGWRYTPGQYGDTSVLGWQIMALTSARRADIDVPDDAFEVARDWLKLVDHPTRPGQYRYQPDRNVTPAMTAEGMFVKQLLGARRDARGMRGSAQYILQHPPRWNIDPNTYYWYYATLALYQHQGAAWERWNEAVKEQLVTHQRKDGSAAGSWDPEGRWSQVAGRIYQTTMCTLTLEVYYRYLPSFVLEQ